MKRRLIISTEANDQASRSLITAASDQNDALRKRGINFWSSVDSSGNKLEARGECEHLSDHEIEGIAETFARLADRTSCVFEFQAIPGARAHGEMCTLHPKNEVDGRVVRAFLWEMFGEA